MKTIHFSMIILLGLLSACDSAPDYQQLCQDNPEICNELHDDSWCKAERINVGKANLAQKQQPKGIHQFNQLIAYEKYEKCISHAAKIEHIKAKDKKARRIESMMKARARISEIAEQTKGAQHPRLLYYHWSRFLDKQALESFLALEGTKAVETPESQYELATYYAKTDQKKTLQLLFHSLELFDENSTVNNEVFKTLSSIYAEKQEVKQAYIWLKVLQIFDPEDPDISANTLQNYIDGYQLDAEFLNKVAQNTLDKITSSTFVAPKF
ncbi:DUF2989 domain-containing protein [Thalassotalea sp. G2M2-11]|uniref:DUF2989 domain-containing protein n=1 Tax=Thalassotalea sp. G2M2-11 TaxID=2787627 RepID=UPI0019D202EB|nr:DUF2989 domain-containing protein [Thalassotalea sp. G2M2-11]